MHFGDWTIVNAITDSTARIDETNFEDDWKTWTNLPYSAHSTPIPPKVPTITVVPFHHMIYPTIKKDYSQYLPQDFVVSKYHYYLLVLAACVTVVLSKNSGQDLVKAMFQRISMIFTELFTAIWKLI